MKKAIITFTIALVTALCTWAGNPAKLESLIRQYKGQEGFEVVSLGRLGMSLIKNAAILSGDLDEEDRVALQAFNGIRKLVVVDFEDAREERKVQFTTQLEQVLGEMELVMEMRDSGETVRVYGIDQGTSIQDCILYSSDGALIYAQGTIELQYLGDLMEMQQ